MFWQWITRCLPGLNIVCLVALLSWLSFQPMSEDADEDPRSGWAQLLHLSWLSQIFIIYNLLINIHIAWFVIRTSLAFTHSTRKTKEILSRRIPTASDESLSLKSAEQEVVHAIVIPNYHESVDTLWTTLAALARHPRASSQYEIYLAMELKERGSEQKANILLQQFRPYFREIQATFHPEGLPGEMAGKGPNENYAAHQIRTSHKGDANVIVTIMDADTILWEDYFTEIRKLHFEYGNQASHTLYTCPIIFDRNSHETPFLVRCMDLFWSWVCLSSMYSGSHLSIPVSVYSLPLSLVERVDGWDTDHTAIGEDFHMMLKCFMKLNADLVTREIHVPASQCNISSSGKGWRRTLGTCRARYKQGLRHMWGGALDFGYALRHALNGKRRLLQWKTLILFQRLCEAYILPSHFVTMQLFVGGRRFNVAASQLDATLEWISRVTGPMCAFSLIWTWFCFILYHRWYTMCLEARKRDMLLGRVGHLSFRSLADAGFARRTWWHPSSVCEIFGVYLAGIVYSCVPLVHAAFSHFLTDKLVYEVSAKPNLSRDAHDATFDV